jgi:hypothetical protein
MKKIFLVFVIQLFTIISVFSQTISKPPIFRGSESLTVQFLSEEVVWFGYQNPEYKSIVDIISFSVPNLDNAIELMDKVLYILEMPETGKDEHIYDNFLQTSLARYGFLQKVVLVSEKDSPNRGKSFNKKEAQELKAALLSKKK